MTNRKLLFCQTISKYMVQWAERNLQKNYQGQKKVLISKEIKNIAIFSGEMR